MRHPGRLLTHRAIVAEVWGDPDAAAADNLRVQISQLRRRIEEDPRHPRADRDRARAGLPLPVDLSARHPMTLAAHATFDCFFVASEPCAQT